MRRLFAVAIVVAAVIGVLRITQAEETYPTRTVRFILPFGAASATDITARLLADRLTKRWGKPVVVENRPGGDGLVALNAFLGAHDDHTLFFGPASTFLVHLYDEEKPSYDPRDVMPIAQIYVTVLAISVPASLHIGTMDELIALARAQPGKLNAAAATPAIPIFCCSVSSNRWACRSRKCRIATSCRRRTISPRIASRSCRARLRSPNP